MSTARGPVGGTVDLEADPGRAAELCTRAQARLLAAVEVLADADVRRASRLPGWSIGHVLTHLARNADAHARRLAGALDGQDVAKYPGGAAQRARDIEDGAGRSAAELVQDLAVSQQRLEQLFTACAAAGWPGRRLLGGAHYRPPAARPTGCARWRSTTSTWTSATDRRTGRRSSSPGSCPACSPPSPTGSAHGRTGQPSWPG